MKRLFLLLSSLFFFHTAFAQDGFIEGKPTLAYWQVGNKSEIVIVLHGGPSAQHEYLRPEFDALSKGAKVIYYDQRGCGKSANGDSYIWQEHVKDLKRVISTFSNSNKVILAGSSWGSILAMLYAYSYPEDIKGLILSGTVEWFGKDMSLEDYALYKAGINIPVPHATQKVLEGTIKEERVISSNPAKNRKEGKTIVVKKPFNLFLEGFSSEIHASLVTAPNFDKLKSIQAPVLIFNGDKENKKLPDWGEKYVKILPFAQLNTIYGAGHDPWFSNPQYFAKECNSFISRLNQK